MWPFLNRILDFLFPFCCVSCENEGQVLCKSCFLSLNMRDLAVCPGCIEESSFGVLCQNCSSLEAWKYGLDVLWSMFTYEKGGAIAKLLHLYKYEGLQAYGDSLQNLLSRTFNVQIPRTIALNIDLITWVPLTNSKRSKRGFNQSEAFANTLQYPEKLVKLLYKTKENAPQMSLDKAARITNVLGAYAVIPQQKHQLIGKKVLLVDDVATTLSTLNECAKALKLSGADEVYGLVLARQGV
jgi:ComF family protein